MKRWLLALAVVAAWPSLARAHDFNPGVLDVSAHGGGEYQWRFVAPVDSRGSASSVAPVWPAHCRADGDRLACGDAGLDHLAFEGMHAARMTVVVIVRERGGERREYLVRGDEPALDLEPSRAAGLAGWIRIGVEHILFGPDHVAFVLGLLLLLGASIDRRLLATVTAFTAAHSLTLALAVYGVLDLPSPPVEAAIAASVILVAREAIHDRDTAVRRWPPLVAGLFGLVHGLGFAGAVRGIGLPEESVGASLLGFNLGVELGQLAIVVVAVALARLVFQRYQGAGRARRGVAYALGSLGVWWLVARVLTLGSGGG